MEFYIKEVIAMGPEKPTATVKFQPGLNIICGASDTGKTAILKTIKFLMGGAKPFGKKKNGYDTFALKLQTLSGEITLSRKVGKNIINVVTEVKGIEPGDYDLNVDLKKGNTRPVIQTVWLHLLGIDKNVQVLYNADGVRKNLTMLRLLRSFYLNEGDIDEANSIIAPEKQPSEKVYFLSSLLYLLTGDDFSNLSERDSDKISSAKRNAIRDFAHNRIAELSEQRQKLESLLENLSTVDVESEMNKAVTQLSDVEKTLNEALSSLSEIATTLGSLHDKAAEHSLILNRYSALKTQYSSDIKRLTFIAEGEQLREATPKTTKCPYCSSPISRKMDTNYQEAAKKELARIIIQLQGLEKSEVFIQDELTNNNAQISTLEEQRNSLQKKISKELQPHAQDLKEKIMQYRQYIELQKEYSLIQDFATDLENAIVTETKSPSSDSNDKGYKPRNHFPENFEIDMAQYADSIFTECNYRGFTKAGFDMGRFDILVNGDFKKDSHGKGYYSFINTVARLALRQYLIEKAKYNPGLFIVDTPLHGFDEGVYETDKESMKFNLFKYFISHCTSGQTIVVENKRNLPKIDFEKSGVNIIDFTHGNYESEFSNSRYGFLIDTTS